MFRRIFVPPCGRDGRQTPSPHRLRRHRPRHRRRIVQARAAAAGFERTALGGHSLKRGVHPTRLKQLGRHKSYPVLDAYPELGDPFESHPLSGVL